MADANVDITQGSGTSIDTRTETTNGHHRQVVVLGDPTTNAGVAAVDAINGVSVNVTNATLSVDAVTSITNAIDIADISSGTQTNDVKVTLDSETVDIGNISSGVQTNDVKVTLDSEAVVLGAGSASIGKLGANSGVDIGDVDVTSMPATAGEAGALPSEFVVVAADNGTNTQPLQTSAGGDLKVTLDSEEIAVTLATDSVGLALESGGNLATIAGAVSGTEMQVDVVSSALPTGASTSANQTTIIGHVDGIEGLLGTIDADTSSLAGTVSGSEIQTDIVAELPAGTQTIGKIAPNDQDLSGSTTLTKKYYTNAGAVTDGVVWSPSAGKRWYITDIFINTSAAATVTLEDDLSGGDSPVWKAELAANSGWSHSFNTPLFSGEDGADLLVTTDAGNVYITITGYEI